MIRHLILSVTVAAVVLGASPALADEVEDAILDDLYGHSTVELLDMKSMYVKIHEKVATRQIAWATALADSVRQAGVEVVEGSHLRLKRQKIKATKYEIATIVEDRSEIRKGFLRFTPEKPSIWKTILRDITPILLPLLIDRLTD